MRWLNNKNIFSFLMLLVLVVLGMISYQTYGAFQKYQKAVESRKEIHFVDLLDETISAISKERIASANFMGSHGKKGKETLETSRENVNSKLGELSAYVHDHPTFEIYTRRLTSIRKSLKKVRNSIDTLSSDYRDTFYTKGCLIQHCEKSSKQSYQIQHTAR